MNDLKDKTLVLLYGNLQAINETLVHSKMSNERLIFFKGQKEAVINLIEIVRKW